ncbi:hypothetical protein [Acuticoccus kandeliae]|uniref:hypothetical protein n=1 Tax=Acuticoccus kandeliae TaxID=2073160 RepID=UPI000D3E1464|nr:hypothetical protein [Acuticoccus kandeliae]
MRFIVHIGAHKTGTTTLQRFLSSNSDALATRGILFPQTGRGEDRLAYGAHHPIAAHILHGEVSRPVYEAIGDKIAAEVAEAKPTHLILSSESFSMVAVPRLAGALHILAERLGVTPELMIYERPQASSIHSQYTQRAKTLATTQSFAEEVAENLAPGPNRNDYFGRLKRLRSIDDVEILPVLFTDSVKREGITANFFRVLGISDALSVCEEVERVNETPGPKTIYTGRILTGVLNGRRGSSVVQIGDRIRSWSSIIMNQFADQYGWNDTAYNGLDAATAARIMDFYRRSNERYLDAIGATGTERDEFLHETSNRPVNEFDIEAASDEERRQIKETVDDVSAKMVQWEKAA